LTEITNERLQAVVEPVRLHFAKAPMLHKGKLQGTMKLYDKFMQKHFEKHKFVETLQSLIDGTLRAK
jgi:hypothetical protein